MANDQEIGKLRAKLTADTAEFESGVRRGKQRLDELVLGMQSAGKEASASGRLISGMGQSGKEAADRIAALTKPLDAVALGMNTAGKAASSSGRLIALMGTAGRAELERLDAAAKSASQSMSLMDRAAGLAKSTFGQFTAANLAARGIQTLTSSITGMVSEAIDGASHILDLGNKTGLSTATIQRMQFVAHQTGEELDAFTDAAFKLGVGLSGGDTSVAGALKDLGVSMTELQQMDPSQQFEAMVTALGNVKSETDRNRLGVELFGRSFASIAASVGEGYDDIAKRARLSSDAQLEAIDHAMDRWDQFKDNVKTGVASMVGDFLLERDAMIAVRDEAKRLGQELTADEFERRVQNRITGGLAPGAPRLFTQPGAGASVAEVTFQEARAYDALADRVKKANDEIARIATIREKAFGLDAGKEVNDMLKAIGGIAGVSRMTAEAQAALHKEIGAASDAALRNGKAIPQQWMLVWEATMHAADGVEAYVKALEAAKTAGERLTAPLLTTKNATGLRDIINANPLKGEKSGGSLVPGPTGFEKYIAANLQGTVMSALTGGGSVGKSIGGLFGGGLASQFMTTGIGKSITGGLGSLFGKTVGGSLSALIPGLGAIAGPLLGKAVGALGSLFSGGEGHKTNQARDKNITGFTGIADLGKAQEQFKKMAGEAGVTDAALRQLFDTKKTKDFEKSFADVTAQIQEQQAIVEKYNLNWTNFTGQKRVDEFSKALKGVTGDTEALERAGLSHEEALKKTADAYVELAKQGIAAGEGIEPALAPVIKQLADMGLLTDDMVDALNGVASDGLPTWQQMQEAAEKYGLKIDGMGARYQQLRITDSAKGLLDDFNLLLKGGVPLESLLGEMGDEVNTFVRNAVAMGTEVPESMRGMLQKFVDAGDLTDESGQKLKDLSGIKFAQPLETAIQGLIDKMGELIDKIGGVGYALGSLPDTVPSFSPPDTDVNGAIPMVAGGSGRATGPTMFYSNGDEDFAFSGEGKRFGGGDMAGALIREIKALRREMPRVMKDAVAGV